MEQIITDSKPIIILVDFNLHVDLPNNVAALKFLDLLETFGLKQHVNVATHRCGHTLDLLITRSDDDLVSNLNVTDPIISDHLAVHCKIAFKKPSYQRKEISYRNLKSVDKQRFITDIKKSLLNNFENISDVTELTALYDNTLSSILEQHAPLRKRTVTMRPSSKCYTAEIKAAKSKRRRLERRWGSNKSEDNRKRYIDQCYTVNKLVYQTKMTFYSTLIQENTSNQAVLFNTVDKMLNREAQNKLPSYDNASCLANKFADFFAEKIQT